VSGREAGEIGLRAGSTAEQEQPRFASAGVGRLLAFSDGVFAIAFTILVLDLSVPDGLSDAELGVELRALVPSILSAVLSFAVIGRLWISHHELFADIRAVDRTVLAANVVLLALIALIPFSTRVLADYPHLPIAVIIYSANVGAVAVVQLAVWLRATHRRRLVTERVDGQTVLAATLGLSGFAAGFLVAIPVARWSTSAAMACWLIGLVPTDRIAARIHARRHRPAPRPG
jgi:uncharacterized membrane protein